MKPKNISIKKIMQKDDSLNDHNPKCRNSRKSLRLPRKQMNEIKPSPIGLMKKQNYPEDLSEHSNQQDFIQCINGYLNKLDVTSTDTKEIQKIKTKIDKQKAINRNLQLNIIEFQRILLERSEKIEKIEQMLNKFENKENRRDYANQIQLRKRISREKSHKNLQFCLDSSEEEDKYYVESRLVPQYSYERSKRRRTEIPADLEKMISKTIEMKQNRKASNRFF